MEEELVSVIVPVYNIEDYLPRCLACIEMQTYRNLEIILVNDGSTDGSGKICDEFAVNDPRARVIHHPENRGAWAARNTGLDAAHGDYLWLPDGDDYFHKDIVKILLEAINQTNSSGKTFDLAMVKYKRTFLFDEDVSSIISPKFVEESLKHILEISLRPDAGFSGIYIWTKMCRKTVIDGVRIGEYRYAEDFDFSMKLFLKTPSIVIIDNVLYYYLNRESSLVSSPRYLTNATFCAVKIFNDLYYSYPKGDACCRRYILEALYLKMFLLLELTQAEDFLADVRSECRTIVRRSWRDYLRCEEINTPKKRLCRVLKIRFDRLYRFYLQVR